MRTTAVRCVAALAVFASPLIAQPGRGGATPASVGAGLVEALRIGTVDGDERTQLLRVRGVVIDPANGDVYVANGGSYSIRVFSATGTFVREIGRRGDGPGEFQSLGSPRIVGDTLFAQDITLSRTSALRRDGTLFATWPNVSTDRGREPVTPIASVPGGWLVAEFKQNPGNWVPGARMIPSTVFRRTPAAAPSQSVADLVGDTVFVLWGRDFFAISTPMFVSGAAPLFAPMPTFGVDGKANLYTHGGMPYVITVRDLKGTVIRQLTRPHTPRPVTSQMIDEFRKRAKAFHDTVTNKGGECAASYAVDMARPGLKSPSTLPPLGRMLVARDGAVRVERIDLVQDPVAREWTRGPIVARTTLWDRFDATGAPQRSVELPVRYTPMAATPDGVIGVLRDADGVEFVVRYVVR